MYAAGRSSCARTIGRTRRDVPWHTKVSLSAMAPATPLQRIAARPRPMECRMTCRGVADAVVDPRILPWMRLLRPVAWIVIRGEEDGLLALLSTSNGSGHKRGAGLAWSFPAGQPEGA